MVESGSIAHRIKVALSCAALCSIVACGSPDSQSADTSNTADTSAPAPPDPAQLALSERPADEVRLEALLKAVNDANNALFDQKNAIIEAENFNKAYMAFCAAMQKSSGTLTNWTAVVKNIYAADSTSKPSIALTTPEGLGAYQEIDQHSQLYKIVRGLKEGDYVKFSLKINHVEEAGEVYKECDHPYDGGEVPHLNTMIGGDITELSPLS